jgi:hypothetical protein
MAGAPVLPGCVPAPTLPIAELSDPLPMLPIAEPPNPLPSVDSPTPLPIVPIVDGPVLPAVGEVAFALLSAPSAAYEIPQTASATNAWIARKFMDCMEQTGCLRVTTQAVQKYSLLLSGNRVSPNRSRRPAC